MLEGRENYDDITIYKNPIMPLPRVFIPKKINLCENVEKKIIEIRKFLNSRYCFENESWCEKKADTKDTINQDGNVLSVKILNNKREIKIENKSTRIIVLNERYDPNWKAKSKSESLEIREVNGFMIGIILKEKETAITLERLN
jgi:uncharacterized membrane protein YfhO